jgi:hypothetical protein
MMQCKIKGQIDGQEKQFRPGKAFLPTRVFGMEDAEIIVVNDRSANTTRIWG